MIKYASSPFIFSLLILYQSLQFYNNTCFETSVYISFSSVFLLDPLRGSLILTRFPRICAYLFQKEGKNFAVRSCTRMYARSRRGTGARIGVDGYTVKVVKAAAVSRIYIGARRDVTLVLQTAFLRPRAP